MFLPRCLIDLSFIGAALNRAAESIAKTLGFFPAAVFFIYKAISAYLITDRSVKLDFNRQR